MKTYQVAISEEARQNLKEIIGYIRRADSDAKAKYVRTEVLKLVRSLVKLPNRHPTLLVSEASGLTYRYVPNKFKVKIIYHVEEEQTQQVIVVRMYHDRQSLKELKKQLP